MTSEEIRDYKWLVSKSDRFMVGLGYVEIYTKHLEPQLEKKDKIIGVLEGAAKDIQEESDQEYMPDEMVCCICDSINTTVDKALAEVKKIREGK